MRLLDLFCCEGGAATGYARAGFEVVGVDIEPQPNYPFEFWQDDALSVLDDLVRWRLGDFVAIHASPPCQAYTMMSNRWRGKGGVADSRVELIGPVRDRLVALGVPYVIENVAGARSELVDPLRLTGEMFGLRVHRPRLFETNFPIMGVPAPPRQTDPVAVYGRNDQRRLWTRSDGTELRAATLEGARAAMGMPWASWDGCREAIPPAYTEFIGHQLMAQLERVAA